MKRFWLPMLFFAFSLPAQEGAPEQDPDIVLPPMFLEIEDKTKENIRVGLPKEDSETEITLPELTVPMPDPAEAVFETERIDEFLTEIGTQNALTPSDSPRTPSAAVPVIIDAHAEKRRHRRFGFFAVRNNADVTVSVFGRSLKPRRFRIPSVGRRFFRPAGASFRILRLPQPDLRKRNRGVV